jgi:hypothetical protein
MNISEWSAVLALYGLLALLLVLAVIQAKRNRKANGTDHLSDLVEDEEAYRSGGRISGDW